MTDRRLKPEFLKAIQDYEELTPLLEESLDEDQLFFTLSCLLIPILRLGHKTPQRAMRLFRDAESMGSHVLPVHFYSPVPEIRQLPENIWRTKYPLPLDAAAQLELLRHASAHMAELGDFTATGNIGKYPLQNSAFGLGDAMLYYSMIRHLRPKRLVEVGCGYSSLIAREACNRQQTRMEGIEPFPSPSILSGVFDELRTVPVQDVALDYFAALEPGDILFIDSTHAVKIGSDVNYICLQVLPCLQRGVIVHIHDIFLPYEYPRAWIYDHHIFWAEAYLLAALVQGGNWDILAANHWLCTDYASEMQRLFPMVTALGGGSWWMRKGGSRSV